MRIMQALGQKQNYWIISFSSSITNSYANVVAAPDRETALTRPIVTYLVNYDGLRYLYVDLASEAEKVFHEKRKRINPGTLANPRTTVDDILALPQMKGNQTSLEDIECRLRQCRVLAESDPKMFRQMVAEYETDQRTPDDELMARVRAEIDSKRNYKPEETEPLTQRALALALPNAGYLVQRPKPFESMQSALDSLNSAWEMVKSDDKLGLYMYHLPKSLFGPEPRALKALLHILFLPAAKSRSRMA